MAVLQVLGAQHQIYNQEPHFFFTYDGQIPWQPAFPAPSTNAHTYTPPLEGYPNSEICPALQNLTEVN